MREDVFIKLGTLSHNQSFSRADFLSYAGSEREFAALKRGGFIQLVDKRQWYPTAKGWEAIERAYGVES